MHIPSWAVATAILLSDAEIFDINLLAQAVVHTGWSDLAKDGETPEKTLGSDLRRNCSEFITSDGNGNYTVTDKTRALRLLDVRRALQRITVDAITHYQQFLTKLFESEQTQPSDVKTALVQHLNLWQASISRLHRLAIR